MAEVARSVVTDEMRAAIGREGPPIVLEVEKANCRMFARAVGHSDAIFYDEAAAKARGYRGIVAPPGFLGTPIFLPRSGSGAPGETGGRAFSVPYKRVLNGGTEYEYFPDGPDGDVICAGDTITARSRITGFEEAEGSLGPMLITKRETVYTNQHGKVVARMYGTMIQY
ncbi:MAG TPA: MaoC family dehydratase N-terminal domain-containing protein [Dehalococcoidia bacterium]|nr:MaoC family dehydratase N-terminal domain-containing protein [Dehalococcoidia bacterium]